MYKLSIQWRKKTYQLYATVLVILMLVGGVVLFCNHYRLQQTVIEQTEAQKITGELVPGMELNQDFIFPENGLDHVDVLIATYARANMGEVQFMISQMESSEVLAPELTRSQTAPMGKFADNCLFTFQFPCFPDSAGKRYLFTISSENASIGNAITAYWSEGNPYEQGSLSIGSTVTTGDLCFRAGKSLSAGQAALKIALDISTPLPGPFHSERSALVITVLLLGLALLVSICIMQILLIRI